MTRARTVALVLVTFAGLLAAGCTITPVAVNPTVPPGLADKQVPVKVALFLDPEFRTYQFQQVSVGEITKLDFDLGPASTRLFVEALTRVSPGVREVTKAPPYEPGDNVDCPIVVEPHILRFNATEPIALRILTYRAEIEYRVVVRSRDGTVLLDKTYCGKGAARGMATHNYSVNYAKPASLAMGDAVEALVNDLIDLKLSEPKP